MYDANGKLTDAAFDGIVPKLFKDDIEYDGPVKWDIQVVNSNGNVSSTAYAPKIEINKTTNAYLFIVP